MVYSRKTTKFVGQHRHTRGLNLSQEADMVLNNVMKSSGFFRGPSTGPNSGYGTENPSMENFIGKWNALNFSSRKGNRLPYAKGSKIHKFRGI